MFATWLDVTIRGTLVLDRMRVQRSVKKPRDAFRESLEDYNGWVGGPLPGGDGCWQLGLFRGAATEPNPPLMGPNVMQRVKTREICLLLALLAVLK